MSLLEIEKYLFNHGFRKTATGNWKQPGVKNFRYVFYNITLRFEQKIGGVWHRVSSCAMLDLRVVNSELRGMV